MVLLLMFMFLLRNPMVLLAFPQMLLMCCVHFKSEVMLSPIDTSWFCFGLKNVPFIWHLHSGFCMSWTKTFHWHLPYLLWSWLEPSIDNCLFFCYGLDRNFPLTPAGLLWSGIEHSIDTWLVCYGVDWNLPLTTADFAMVLTGIFHWHLAGFAVIWTETCHWHLLVL